MDIAEMNTQAQETAQQMKRQFPEMTDEQIIKVTRFYRTQRARCQRVRSFSG